MPFDLRLVGASQHPKRFPKQRPCAQVVDLRMLPRRLLNKGGWLDQLPLDIPVSLLRSDQIA